jgi:hypothetical protein
MDTLIAKDTVRYTWYVYNKNDSLVKAYNSLIWYANDTINVWYNDNDSTSYRSYYERLEPDGLHILSSMIFYNGTMNFPYFKRTLLIGWRKDRFGYVDLKYLMKIKDVDMIVKMHSVGSKFDTVNYFGRKVRVIRVKMRACTYLHKKGTLLYLHKCQYFYDYYFPRTGLILEIMQDGTRQVAVRKY